MDTSRMNITALVEQSKSETNDSIVLPEILSMPEYLRSHYESDIVTNLFSDIVNAKIGVLHKRKTLYNNASYVDTNRQQSVLVTPVEGHIHRMSFFRVADCIIEAILSVDATVRIRQRLNNREEQVSQRFYCKMWFDTETEFVGEIGRFSLHEYRESETGIALDEYLIPILGRDGIDQEAERLIDLICPEARNNLEAIHPGLFAERLGLNILYRNLYQRPKTASILFFKDGDIEIEMDNKECQIEHVAANTIVLNQKKVGLGGKTAIFHECFHYIEHNMFFQLQQMHNDDISDLLKHKQVKLEKGKRSPIEWMEWQAHYASLCLQMPESIIRNRITAELLEIQNNTCHMGYKLQTVGRKLADEFHVCKYQMRNRMIHLGYIAAKGSLNFVDNKYITPFAFDLSECRGSHTFVISRKDMLSEYLRNESFREIIDSGMYVYVDGHVCFDSPEYVEKSQYGYSLTQAANERVNTCCLRFFIKYTRDKQTQYIFGQLNSDEEYNSRSLAFALQENDNVLKRASAMSEVLMNLPSSFHGALRKHMERSRITHEKLAELSGLSVPTIQRLCAKERNTYLIDHIIAICIGLHLPPEFSFDLLKKANQPLKATPEHLVYSAILSTMYTSTLDEIQNMLRDCGCKTLKINEKKQ